MATRYATPSELSEFMGLKQDYPIIDRSSTSIPLELLGTGDDSRTIFFTQFGACISGSYTFYYGSTDVLALGQSLTETTHYVFDVDDGVVTLTGAGVTLVSTNNVYAKYSANSQGLTEEELQVVLDESAARVDDECKRTWDSADLVSVVDESHKGRGRTDLVYQTNNYPIDTSSVVFKVSTTEAGSTPVFSTLTAGADYVANETGLIQLQQSYLNQISMLNYPQKSVFDRVRISYDYGATSVPTQISWLCKAFASEQVLHMIVRKAHGSGFNDFNPSMINVDRTRIQEVIDKYRLEYWKKT